MGYEIGTRVGDYEILDQLGVGGMGLVYKVRNVISDRVEAMKILLPNLDGDPELADRFMREIKVQASLDHKNIAALHTALRVENQLLMLMEYVEGTTLEGVMRSGRVPIDQAVDYAIQVLSALSYAHAKGVIHRDLKPANMMLTPQGVIKLMDFGIAKLAADRKLTQTGRTVGSLYYMSPEQIKGAVDLDARSDLYSLGISLYEILVGARPFQGDSEYSIMVAHLEHTPVPLLQIDPSLPPALSEIVLKSFGRDPNQRFQSADAFRNALLSLKLVQEPPHAAAVVPPPPVYAPPPPAYAPPPLAYAPPPPPVAPPPAPPQSRRGLYIALGSLLTVAVLVVAAMQAPKFFRTSAGTTSQSPATQIPEPAAAVSTPPAAAPAAPPVTSAPLSQPPGQVSPEPQTRASAPAGKSAPRRAEPAPQNQPPAPVLSQPAPSQPPPQAPQQQPAQAAPAAAPDAGNAAKLQEVREHLMLLVARENAVKASIDNLRREQARLGLGLRPDIAAGLQRMEYYLDETEGALKKGDSGAAKKSLDSADREVSKLEGFMGR